MFKIKVPSMLLIVGLYSCTPDCAQSQTQLDVANEIKLPVPSSRGNFGKSFPILGESANEKFSMKVTPDQSLLVLAPDANGKWPLVRVKKWWTKAPENEVLNIPGWNAADTKYGEVEVDLQITPDGHYVVVFAAARWDGPLFRSKNYVARQPDTLITVIDLQRWQIAGSTHTINTDYADFRGARILSNQWIVLQGFDTRPGLLDLYNRRNRLISIPDLKPGPGCLSERHSYLWPEPWPPEVERKINADSLSRSRRNDEVCSDVLKISGTESVKTLESIIYKGHDQEPKVLMMQSLNIHDENELDGDKAPFPAVLDEREQDAYYDHWNWFRRNEYQGSSPEESSSHLWYQLYGLRKENESHYGIGVFDEGGRKLLEQAPEHLLNEDPQVKYRRCSIEDISESQHAVLTYCHSYRLGFDEQQIPSKQWLSVFRSDDLSEVGAADISKDKRTSEAIAIAEGHAYVLTVEQGETLRVFAVPNRP